MKPEHLIEIGIQDLMPSEYDALREHRIRAHPMHELDRKGVRQICADAIATLERETDGFFVSVDIDVCQAEGFGACAAPMVGGMTAREVCSVVELARCSDKFCGMDIVEFCPGKDTTGNTGRLIGNVLHTLVGYTDYFAGDDPNH